MKPIDKVKLGYLTWSENFEIEQPFTVTNKKERIFKGVWYHMKFAYRYLFNKPVTWESKLKEYKRIRQDLSQINPSEFYDLQKKLN